MKTGLIYGLLGLSAIGGGAWYLSHPSQSVPVSNEAEADSACLYSCNGTDRDCSDFSSHSEAQDFFDCCGFSASNDPMKLDSLGVGDGVACESI